MGGISARTLAFGAGLAAAAQGAAWAEAPAPSALERAFFGGEAAASSDISRLPFWADLLDRASAPASKARKAKTTGAGDAWREDPYALLAAINSEINRAAYRSDIDNWGVADRWQTPRELAARGGDCEDYATAKYFALRAAGAPAEALRIAIVIDESSGQRHAVLLAQVGAEVFVLDNLREAMAPAAATAHYRPLMAMNENGWLLATPELRRPRA